MEEHPTEWGTPKEPELVWGDVACLFLFCSVPPSFALTRAHRPEGVGRWLLLLLETVFGLILREESKF